MAEIKDWLSEESEYFARCDDCDAESTRDGSTTIAAAHATIEGFEIDNQLKTRCKECVAKQKTDEQGKGVS
jgi:hypothetical protein